MLNYNSLTYLYLRIHRRIWNILFRSNFKSFGDSTIAFPWKIRGAQFIEIGDNVNILSKIWLDANKIDDNSPQIVIGDRTRINRYSTISAVKEVRIGKDVIIGERSYLSDNTHEYENIELPIRDQPIKFNNSVYIGDESWLGANVTILGAKVGKHCVIGVNSIVTKDIPDYSVAIGAPAKVIKKYNFDKGIWERVTEDI